MFVLFCVIALFRSFSASMPIPDAIIDLALAADVPLAQTHKLRTRFDIIWSCASTLFICTWVAIHPNVPPRNESPIWSLLRRIRLMLWMLVVPEFILIWAYKQWAAARYIADIFKDEGWTATHGHFLIMGGFSLDRAGVETVLDYESFFELLKIETRDSRSRREPIFSEAFEIAFPTITAAEIHDKARGDFLSKAIVILQSLWFIMQCIARGKQGLALTELELVTLALASLNGVMYYFWWDKPLGVQEPIKVYPKGEGPAEKLVHGTGRLARFEESSQRSPYQKFIVCPCQELRCSLFQALDHLRLSLSKCISTISEFLADQRECLDLPGGIYVWAFLYYPLLFTLVYPLGAVGVAVAGLVMGLIALAKELFAITTTTELDPHATHVPTFYAPRTFLGVGSFYLFVFVLPFVASSFGALHCIGWNFRFPTHNEQLLWRIGSLAITIIPLVPLAAVIVGIVALIIIMPIGIFIDYLDENVTVDWTCDCNPVVEILCGIIRCIFEVIVFIVEFVGTLLVFAAGVAVGAGAVGYMLARLMLLAQAIVLLRDQPESAFYAIDWSYYLPHI